MEKTVCVPVTATGDVDPSWGKAERVALMRVSETGAVTDVQVVEVGWGRLHDAEGEGSHHARIARFLLDHGVGVVVAHHMGPPMQNMLERMHITIRLGAHGDARQAVATALSA